MKKALIATAVLALAATPAVADDVTYDVGGETFTGYFAGAENPKGIVLIVHDWDGMDDYERRRADMLAEMGYDAFALDMFGAGTPVETVEHRRAATGALYGNRERMQSLIAAGAEQARSMSSASGMVVMGYCFGGAVALEAARTGAAGDLAGAVSFHGGLATPEGQSWDGIAMPVLVLHGGADTSITLPDVADFAAALEASGTPYTIEIYSGAPHAFTVFGSNRYQERADKESWEAFSDFLEETLPGEGA